MESALKGLRIKVCLRVAGEDFDFVNAKYAALFASKANLTSGGGLLVRPDQHLIRVVETDDDGETIATAVRTSLAF